MCVSSPKMPAPVASPATQDAKGPSTQAQAQATYNKRKPSAAPGGTLLTGSEGVSGAPTGKVTLLGE